MNVTRSFDDDLYRDMMSYRKSKPHSPRRWWRWRKKRVNSWSSMMIMWGVAIPHLHICLLVWVTKTTNWQKDNFVKKVKRNKSLKNLRKLTRSPQSHLLLNTTTRLPWATSFKVLTASSWVHPTRDELLTDSKMSPFFKRLSRSIIPFSRISRMNIGRLWSFSVPPATTIPKFSLKRFPTRIY